MTTTSKETRSLTAGDTIKVASASVKKIHRWMNVTKHFARALGKAFEDQEIYECARCGLIGLTEEWGEAPRDKKLFFPEVDDEDGLLREHCDPDLLKCMKVMET